MIDRFEQRDGRLPHAFHSAKFVLRGREDLRQAAKTPNELVGERPHILAQDGKGKEQFQHYFIRACRRPACQKALSEPPPVSRVSSSCHNDATMFANLFY